MQGSLVSERDAASKRRSGGRFGLKAIILAFCCVTCGRDRWSARVPGPRAALLDSANEPMMAGSAGSGQAAPGSSAWARETASPSFVSPHNLHLPRCAAYEQALMGVADAVARRQAARAPALESSELVAMLRALGSPHVWPRVWTLEAETLSEASIGESWQAWLSNQPGAAEWRCGVARRRGAASGDIVVGVVVDALADLDPMPIQARLGQWLRLDAHLLQPALDGRVVLLGPRGMPMTVPSRLTPTELHSVFSLDQPGLWRIQVLLGAARGPRPALEAWVFVDEPPNYAAGATPAPGEHLARNLGPSSLAPALARSLFEMLNAARASEQLPPLRRDPRLDALALAHAEAMWGSGQTAHDAGDGSPLDRVVRGQVRAFRVGENVAHTSTLAAAHRALWNSPSHRGNLLDMSFDAVGVGVVVEEAPGPGGAASARDPALRSVWVCELFADFSSHSSHRGPQNVSPQLSVLRGRRAPSSGARGLRAHTLQNLRARYHSPSDTTHESEMGAGHMLERDDEGLEEAGTLDRALL
jgi:hypothetical protein